MSSKICSSIVQKEKENRRESKSQKETMAERTEKVEKRGKTEKVLEGVLPSHKQKKPALHTTTNTTTYVSHAFHLISF